MKGRLRGFARQMFQHLRQYRWQKPRVAVCAFVLLLLIAVINYAGLAPSEQNFEGILIVDQLGFTTNSLLNRPRTLLNEIRGISQLKIGGKQSFTLSGSFKSKDEPRFNQYKGELQVELLDNNSYWVINLNNSIAQNELELHKLQFMGDAVINYLGYSPYTNRISLSVQPIQSSEGSTILELNLGSQPIELELHGYYLSNFGLRGENSSKHLIYYPDNGELPTLSFSERMSLSLMLINPSQSASDSGFWANLPVKEVKFEKQNRIEDDEQRVSTILTGKLRMVEQEMELEPNQFLTIGKPGIKKLSRIRVKPEGLEVVVVGRTKQLESGLEPEFPVSTLFSSALSYWFPRDVIIAIVSFSSAIAASLVSWLVTNLRKSSSP